MSLRILYHMLASLLPDQYNNTESIAVAEKEDGEPAVAAITLEYIQNAAKFHIGMLTISLLVGIAYGGYVGYTCWMEKDALLGYIRNLVIALTFRTFFTILFDGVVLLGGSTDVAGANTLSSFEQILLNLVLGLWLSFTVYAHARVQRNFKSEPTLRLYQYGIPVVAMFFAFVWIFSMHDSHSTLLWWALRIFSSLLKCGHLHWIANSINLLCLLIQLGLVADMCRMMMVVKGSLDNDSVSLLWRVAAMMGALVLIFWLQFGLSVGPYINSYLYFFYFMDGMECALVCVCLYFFQKWVAILLNNKGSLFSGCEETVVKVMTESKDEEFLPGGRGIVTIDSMFMTQESGRRRASSVENSKDVVYSNVVEPHRLQKTLELYKRLNIVPNQATIVEGEEFYDCRIPIEGEMENRKLPSNSVSKSDIFTVKGDRMFEPVQKKNAFYASKYLILDSKENDFPKYLETRPSVSSVSEKDSQKEERIGRIDFPVSLEAGELVRKWLNDNSENMPKNRKMSRTEDEETREIRWQNSDRKPDLKLTLDKQDSLQHKDRPSGNPPGKDDGGNMIEKDSAIPIPDNSEEKPNKHAENTDFPACEKQIGLESKSKPSVSNRKKQKAPEIPGDVKKKEEFKPSESVLPVHVSGTIPKQEKQSEGAVPGAKNAGEPEAKDKQTQPTKAILTYSELLEFRSERDKLDPPPVSKHTFSESIFSKLDSLMNVGSNLLNSITGFSQAQHDSYEEDDFRIDDRLTLQLSDGSKTAPEQLFAEKLQERPETLKIKEDSEITDRLPKHQQGDSEFQSKRLHAEKLKEETETPVTDKLKEEYNMQKVNVKVDSKIVDGLPKQPQIDLKFQPEEPHVEKLKEEPETQKVNVKVGSKIVDGLPKQPQIDLKFQPEEPHAEKLKEEPETQKVNVKVDTTIGEGPPKQPQDDLQSETDHPLVEKMNEEQHKKPIIHSDVLFSSLPENLTDAEISSENITNREINEEGQYRKESETKRVSDLEEQMFIEPTPHKSVNIKPIEKQPQDQAPRNSTEDKDELGYSCWEFSAKNRQSSEISTDRLGKTHQEQQSVTSDAQETQLFETSDSEFSIERKQSSSSESFSLEQYYTQVMAAKSKFENQQSPLQMKKSHGLSRPTY